jgi:lysophospholipase L1-like esterase
VKRAAAVFGIKKVNIMRLLIFLTLLGWPLAAQGTRDSSQAETTVPNKPRALEPGLCGIGEAYLNTTTGKLRRCIAANVWGDVNTVDASGNASAGSLQSSAADGATGLVRRGIMAEYRMNDATGTLLPDSSGNGNDGTLVAVPAIGLSGVAFNGSTQRVDLPAGLTANVTSACVYFSPPTNNTGATGQYQPLVAASTKLGFHLFSKDGSSSVVNTTPALFMNDAAQTIGAINEPLGAAHVCVVLDASADHLYVNGVEAAQYKSQKGNIATPRVGTLSLAGGSGYGIYAAITIHYAAFYSVALTSAEVLANYQAVNAVLSRRGVAIAAPANGAYNSTINCIGDSITKGLGGAIPPCSQLSGLTDTFATPYILGVAGMSIFSGTLSMIDTAGAELAAVYTPQAKRNVAIIFAGTNDMLVSSGPASTFDHLVAMCRMAKKTGYQVLVVPMISRTGAGFGAATMDSLKNSYNALIMANWPAFADGVIDPVTLPGLYADLAYNNTARPTACNGGTCFQGDGIHPTTNGGKALADAFSAAINVMALRAPGSGPFVQATDPGCTAVGRTWFDVTTTTTVYKVCTSKSGSLAWVTK